MFQTELAGKGVTAVAGTPLTPAYTYLSDSQNYKILFTAANGKTIGITPISAACISLNYKHPVMAIIKPFSQKRYISLISES